MKKNIFFTVLMFSPLTFSQKIKILDEETRNAISYAKLILKDKDYYKNTEENGETFLEIGEEITEIQSFGYENFKVEKYQQTYFLKPKFTEIKELQIAKPKLSKTFTIGKVAKENTFYGVNNTIWMVAKEFRNNISEKPVFVQSLKFYSRLYSKNSATIKINIYYNENGVPGDLYKSIIATCLRKKKITKYIFSKPFQLPKEGIIIGFEWILNQENSYQKTMLMNGEKKEITAHDPMIGSITENPKNIILGSLSKDGWIFKNISNNPTGGIGNLAIELELIN